MRFGEKRLNHLLEIVVIGRVDFRCDLKRVRSAKYLMWSVIVAAISAAFSAYAAWH
jgi:hypothetical protein